MRTLAAVFVVFLGVLLYFIYAPMPNGIADPHKLRLVDAGLRALRHVAKAGAFLGFGTEPQMLRRVYDSGILGLQEPHKTIQAYFTIFDHVRVRVYEPVKKKEDYMPALLYFHGGGFMFGSIETYDETMMNIARKLKVFIVSVDYRRAPEHKYPTAFKDCARVTRYILNNAEKHHIDAMNVAVAGDSAGGNLAAAVALKLSKDYNLPPLRFQALIYPALQAIDFTLPSYMSNEQATTGILAGREQCAWFFSNYAMGNDSMTQVLLDGRAYNRVKSSEKVHILDHMDHENVPSMFQKTEHKPPPRKNETEDVPYKLFRVITSPSFAPLMAEDHELATVPPAYILTAGFDMLRDDGILYMQRLEENNVTVKWDHFHDGFHGMFMFGGGPITFEIGRHARKSFIEYARHMFKYI
ncbi:neutral cholesterol ester hydrolase 1-like [Glandiceps talaboti]